MVDEVQVLVPLVSDNLFLVQKDEFGEFSETYLAASEASNGNNHGFEREKDL